MIKKEFGAAAAANDSKRQHFLSDVESGISLHLRWVHGGLLFTKSAISPLIVHDLVSA